MGKKTWKYIIFKGLTKKYRSGKTAYKTAYFKRNAPQNVYDFSQGL